jgi:hypothetical protein
MKDWRPDVELCRLLLALGDEILSASDDEVRHTARDAGRSLSGAAREVSELIAVLNDNPDESGPAVPPPDAAHRREPCARPH